MVSGSALRVPCLSVLPFVPCPHCTSGLPPEMTTWVNGRRQVKCGLLKAPLNGFAQSPSPSGLEVQKRSRKTLWMELEIDAKKLYLAQGNLVLLTLSRCSLALTCKKKKFWRA